MSTRCDLEEQERRQERVKQYRVNVAFKDAEGKDWVPGDVYDAKDLQDQLASGNVIDPHPPIPKGE